ncbi:hypoxia-inducible factor 1-alpha-like [Asterias rubens]|uniref:hypoxia-inducible factor 1-alpha-like n=1 Tax=Asterias rubens TaxID=7604 RepID=UPI00145514BC|nr:hypoxia-inducible factor 1-alpha-like [Asterias rubens]
MKMATMTAQPPKEKKRRNSEKRKLKSRNAARTRREKETSIFYELAHELPMPHSMCAQLDKSGIMRLLLSFLNIRKFAPKAIKSEPVDTDGEESALSIDSLIDNYYLKALDGFAMILSQDGDIIFISENVTQYMGLKQIDLMGQSIYDYSHPCDHDEIREHLSDHPRLNIIKSSKSKQKQQERHNFIIRMKCTLTAKGKIVTQKAAIYKVVCCKGLLKVSPSEVTTSGYRLPEVSCVSLIAMPIQHPANIEIPMDKQTFLTRHSMDMNFTYCDERIKDLLGYDPDDLVDKSFYDFYHAMDSHVIEKCHRDLFAKGQASSEKYRFLAKKSGYAWMETQATVIYNSKTNKPQCVVCVNYMISGVEDDQAVISTHQLDEGIQLSTEEIFVQRPDDLDDDDVFPLYLTGSKSKVANPEDLTYLAPTPGSAMVLLDFTTPLPNLSKTTEAQELQRQDSQTQDFVPFFPFVALDTIPEDQQSSDGGTNQEPSQTPDLILPETKSHMRSSRDPLLLDGFMENPAQLDDLSKRAPYISLSDDFDFNCDQQLSDAELRDDSWEPVNIFGSNVKNNPCVVSVGSPSVSDDRQDLLSPLPSDGHTGPSTPYSQISVGSPMTPVKKLCQSMPNLWVTTDDCGDGELSVQSPGKYMWPSPQLQQPSPLVSPTGSQALDEGNYYIDLNNQSKEFSPQLAVKRKRETQDVQPLFKMARRENQGQEAGASFDGGGSEMGGAGWKTGKTGVELEAAQPPSDEGMSGLQSLLFQQDGTNINNLFGHSLLLQKVAQQVVNNANMVPSGNPLLSSNQLSPGGSVGPKHQFPSFLTQPVTVDLKDKASADNTLVNCLLLTSQDLDVNTPLQASTGLLQGEDLLRALDVP